MGDQFTLAGVVEPEVLDLAGDVANILGALRRTRIRVSPEAAMQDDVDQVLSAAGVTFTREARLDARDRPDFLTTSGLAIELKVAGGRSAVVRQLLRYAEHEEVTGILLVTSRSRHLGLPDLLGGKPAWEHHAVSL